MSWVNYIQLNKNRFKEGDVLKAVGEVLASEAYYIKSVSNRYSLQQRQKFKRLCEFTHGGGFDLLLLNLDFGLIGVEVKSILSMHSYQSALGQCFVYMNEELYRHKLKEVIIFAHRFQNDRIFEYIKRDFQIQKQKTMISMKIRTLVKANGPYGEKEIA